MVFHGQNKSSILIINSIFEKKQEETRFNSNISNLLKIRLQTNIATRVHGLLSDDDFVIWCILNLVCFCRFSIVFKIKGRLLNISSNVWSNNDIEIQISDKTSDIFPLLSICQAMKLVLNSIATLTQLFLPNIQEGLLVIGDGGWFG
jgi:hypothetical protein